VIEACETLEYAWDIPLTLKTLEDYDTVVYIDPDYSGGDSDGSFEKPYTSWGPLKQRLENQLAESPSHTAYVQKRGTSTDFDAGYGFIAVHGDHILLGAYGDIEQPRPIIYNANIHLEGKHLLIRDLEIIGTSSSSYSKAIILHGQYNTLYNNKIHGENDVDRFLGYCISGNSFGAKIVNNEIYNCRQDAIYGAGRYIEIGHNKIHNIDIAGKGPADIIQFIYSTCEGYWIHHNDFDGREIDNKFAMINTDCDDADNSYGVVEHNVMVMSNRPMFHVAGRMIMRNNRFIQDSDRNPAESGFEPVLWSYLTHLEAYNNTFTNTKLASSTPSNLILTNNTFIYPQDETVAIESATNSIYSSSFNVGDATENVADVFLDFPENLRLTNDSPARAAGSATVFSSLSDKYKAGDSLVDLDGKTMPGVVVDVGAYQSFTP